MTNNRDGFSLNTIRMQLKNALIVEKTEEIYDWPTSLLRGMIRVEYANGNYSSLIPKISTSAFSTYFILLVSVFAWTKTKGL